MSFAQILARYRAQSFSERNKGDRFERLIQRFMLTYPVYQGKFEKVWLWRDFPFRKDFGDGRDTGIDLVAKTTQGEYWAIQCKCWDESSYIDKPAVDTFLSTSGKSFHDDLLQKTRFAARLWVSTTNKWTSEAENTLKNQSPPVFRLGLYELENAAVDWQKLDQENSGNLARNPPKSLRPHQQVAVNDAHKYFKNHIGADGCARGKLIMACGTGKTFTAFLFLQETNKTEVRRFDVKIDIDSENPPAPDFALVAEFPNGLRAESTSINIPAKTKKSLTIGMKFVQETLPKSLSHIEGNVTWEARLNAKLDGKTKRITGDTYSVTNADEPKVELFFLYDKPMSFYKSGVWAEALRLCFKKAGVAGLTDPKDISAKITEYCHSKDGHGMIYDVYRGRPCFGVDYTGGTFNLKEYIEKKNVSVIHSDFPVPANTVNCFDSGAAVQTLSGAFGVKTQWIYQWPFGFMAKTNLVGIGECNNPFFIRNGTNKVVDPMDKKRTSFSCHVFVSAKPSTEDIRDACAGPHIGEETLRQYLESAIDKEPMADDWVSLHVKLGASAEEKMKARASFLKDSYNDAEKAALFYTGVVNVKW